MRNLSITVKRKHKNRKVRKPLKPKKSLGHLQLSKTTASLLIPRQKFKLKKEGEWYE